MFCAFSSLFFPGARRPAYQWLFGGPTFRRFGQEIDVFLSGIARRPRQGRALTSRTTGMVEVQCPTPHHGYDGSAVSVNYDIS